MILIVRWIIIIIIIIIVIIIIIIIITIIIRIRIIFRLLIFTFNSAISICLMFIWRSSILFLIIVTLILVTIIVTVDIIGIIIRNIWAVIRCNTIIKITSRRIIVVTVIIRNITGVMVTWILIRYIVIVGTNRSRFWIFTKVIIVIIKIITWDIVMMIWIYIIVVVFITIIIIIIIIIIVAVVIIVFVRVRVIFTIKNGVLKTEQQFLVGVTMGL